MPVLTVIRNNSKTDIAFEKSVLLSDILTANGYFIPHLCGGRGSCKKCTVMLDSRPVLACQTTVSTDCEVILPKDSGIIAVTGTKETGKITDNICFCLDIGTTTLALSLVSLDEKSVIKTVCDKNPQRTFGADVISRIGYCTKNGAGLLQKLITDKISQMTESFEITSVDKMYVSGNTTMLHLLLGEDCSAMGVSPYTPVFLDSRKVRGAEIGIPRVKQVITLEGISSFVGADIVAGINYIGLPPKDRHYLLLDLGTNAEIALIDSNGRILCTAAAAGPCFEGANISCGMSASDGAISAYNIDGSFEVIGNTKPVGVCATGLIDIITNGIKRGEIDESGYMEDEQIDVCENVSVTDKDVREFQLAKSAIRAATERLVSLAGIGFEDIEALFVSGGFSASIRPENAAFVGLIPPSLQNKLKPVNNSSLLGTIKYAYDGKNNLSFVKDAKYVDLTADAKFSELFMEYMMF